MYVQYQVDEMTQRSTYLAGAVFPGKLIAERKSSSPSASDDLSRVAAKGERAEREAFLAQSVFRFGGLTDW